MRYKEWWIEKYSELSYELFDAEYYELNKEEREILDRKMDDVSRDYLADQIDAARDRAKYGGVR